MIVGVIPARFASTRLMGKPLAKIGGKPMIQHTYENAFKSKFLERLIIATDDEKICEAARNFGAEVMLTPKDINTGSDRIAYVVEKIPSADIIVNIQGDEPFIKSIMIDQAIQPLLFEKSVKVSTLAKKIDSLEDLKSNSIPKVVFDYSNYALYFSRSIIPFMRDAKSKADFLNRGDFYKHIGLYVYRRDELFYFTKQKPTDLEKAEKLEQLRFLEHGIKIKVVVTEYENLAVDTPEDLERARLYYEKLLKGIDND